MTHKKTASLMRADRLNTLTSIAIIAGNSPATQQAFALLALMTFALREVML